MPTKSNIARNKMFGERFGRRPLLSSRFLSHLVHHRPDEFVDEDAERRKAETANSDPFLHCNPNRRPVDSDDSDTESSDDSDSDE